MKKLMYVMFAGIFIVTFFSGCSNNNQTETTNVISLIENSDVIAEILPLNVYSKTTDNKYCYYVRVNWYWSDSETLESEINVVYDDKIKLDLDTNYYVFLAPDTSSPNIYFLATDEDCIIKSSSGSKFLRSRDFALNKSIFDQVGSLSFDDFYYWLVSKYGEPKYPESSTYSNYIS